MTSTWCEDQRIPPTAIDAFLASEEGVAGWCERGGLPNGYLLPDGDDEHAYCRCVVRDGGCFPSSSTLLRDDGTIARVDDLLPGDRVLAAREDGTLHYDTVSRWSLADPTSTAAFIVVRTARANLTLTPAHHIPVGASCCTDVRPAGEVGVGETVWILRDAPGALGSGLVPERVLSVGSKIDRGLHSPVMRHGGFPVVDHVVTSFDALPVVRLAGATLPLLEPLCTPFVRRAIVGLQRIFDHARHLAATGHFAPAVPRTRQYINGGDVRNRAQSCSLRLGSAALALSAALLASSRRFLPTVHAAARRP